MPMQLFTLILVVIVIISKNPLETVYLFDICLNTLCNCRVKKMWDDNCISVCIMYLLQILGSYTCTRGPLRQN